MHTSFTTNLNSLTLSRFLDSSSVDVLRSHTELDEITELLDKLGLVPNSKTLEEFADIVMEEMDEDGSGTVARR